MISDRSNKNPEKWVAGLGLPLVLMTKLPEPPHPCKQEMRGLDTIKAFFPWWLLLFFQGPKSRNKNPEKLQAWNQFHKMLRCVL